MSKLIPALLAAATIGLGSAAYAQTAGTPSPSAAPTAPSTTPDTKATSPSGGDARGGATGQNAPSDRSGASTQPGRAAATTMTEAELRQELQKQGYTSVSDIKKKGDGFEAKAMKDGKRVSLAVDAKSGKVVAR